MPVSPTPSSTSARRVRAGVVLAAGAVALAALTGCTPAATQDGSTGSATDNPGSASPSESVATPTPTPEPAGTTVDVTCDELLTADDVYAFNPNFGTAPDYSPAEGTAAETAATYEGIACAWSSQTSGELIEVSVARPNEVLMTRLKNEAVTEATPVPTYGTPPALDGFFSTVGQFGQAQVFSGPYWIVATSVAFFEPGDAQPIIAAAVSHLP